MVEWPKATDCNPVITAGSNPAPTSIFKSFFIMKKLRTKPSDDFDEITHPEFRDLLNGESADVTDFSCESTDEDLPETGAVIVYLFVSLALVAIILLFIYLSR